MKKKSPVRRARATVDDIAVAARSFSTVTRGPVFDPRRGFSAKLKPLYYVVEEYPSTNNDNIIVIVLKIFLSSG